MWKHPGDPPARELEVACEFQLLVALCPQIPQILDEFFPLDLRYPMIHETGRAQKGTILSPPLFDTAPGTRSRLNAALLPSLATGIEPRHRLHQPLFLLAASFAQLFTKPQVPGLPRGSRIWF